MAANKLIQDLLECGICLHRYNQPRGLPCLHCFCHECLSRYCQGKTHILCPNCRNPTAVPKQGVSGFPAHFMANTLQETLDMEKLKMLGYVGVEKVTKLEVPDVVNVLKGERWKQTGQFRTEPELSYPYGITVNSEGEVALTSLLGSAKVFSQTGDVKYTFQGPFDASLYDIAIAPDNRYVLPGKAELLFYDSQGRMLNYPKASTYDTSNQPSNLRALAVDSRGRIIAGLESNTISIHHADGQLISKFATSDTPRWLAVTSKGDIAATRTTGYSSTLQLMDYSGNNVKEVQPLKESLIGILTLSAVASKVRYLL
ncbi:uncharacterized protein [Amphiura filiformis]|uniref:uncharacterized protein n=1 Tax=Amphiura filiformis TaxID=82378 RepID=UPI003B225A1A